MDKFQKKYIEEATDLINDLEDALLAIEDNPDDKNIVAEIFRVMHSLKGGGSMFGFDKMSEFTHHLETIYDLVRNGHMSISRELLNVTLASVDHLKLLLEDPKLLDPEDINTHKQLSQEIINLIERDNDTKSEKNIEVKTDESANISSYLIEFLPVEDIFENGTNPLFLLDELCSLGDTIVFPFTYSVPPLQDIDPEKCYTYWNIILSTKEEINNINDVFIFVEDECKLDIQKIADYDILSNEPFVKNINDLKTAGEIQKPDILREIILNIKKSEVLIANDDDLQTKITSFRKRKSLSSNDNSISSIRVASDKLDTLMNLVSELVVSQARLALFTDTTEQTELSVISEEMDKITRRLRDIAFSMVLIPIENMLTRYQRLVRDVSNELGKEVAFRAEGVDTELDKTIIENLTEPIMHILRNSLDHGIESVAERRKKGKPDQGEILFKSFYSGSNVIIQISDDGAGIDIEKVRSLAIDKGIIPADKELSQKDLYELVFSCGLINSR